MTNTQRTWLFVGIGGAVILIIILFAVFSGDDEPTTAATTTAPTTTVAETTTTAQETTTTAAEETTTTAAAAITPVKACLLTDLPPGLDDRSFNAGAWAGVESAEEKGFATDILALESITHEDYQPNIDQMVAAGCEHIVTVGFLLGEATATNAVAHPDILWTIVDFSYAEGFDNVRELVYQTDEAAFMAGYLAAGMTQTGFLGTYGGVNLPTVAIFMDGYTRGAQFYNDEKGTNVSVLGWRVEDQDGVFTGSFDDMAVARETAEGLLDEGADMLLPVGGRINLPAGDAIIDRDLDAALLGVDVDNFVSMPDVYQPLWLVTIEKALSLQVERSIQEHAEGTWTGGRSVGTLANGGVGLSDFHAWADRVPAELAAEVEAIGQAIIDGEIPAAVFDVG